MVLPQPRTRNPRSDEKGSRNQSEYPALSRVPLEAHSMASTQTRQVLHIQGSDVEGHEEKKKNRCGCKKTRKAYCGYGRMRDPNSNMRQQKERRQKEDQDQLIEEKGATDDRDGRPSVGA